MDITCFYTYFVLFEIDTGNAVKISNFAKKSIYVVAGGGFGLFMHQGSAVNGKWK